MKRQAQQLDDKRRMELLKDLQDANTRLASSAAKLQATAEKMAYTGTLKSQFTRSPNVKPEVVIFRKKDDARERIVAHEDEPLLPGDAIEVTLPADQWFGTLGQ
jgi:polysaccharide export outer membrane protein